MEWWPSLLEDIYGLPGKKKKDRKSCAKGVMHCNFCVLWAVTWVLPKNKMTMQSFIFEFYLYFGS